VGKPDVRNFRGGAGNRAMADLNRHEAGNGGYGLREPKATAPVLYSTQKCAGYPGHIYHTQRWDVDDNKTDVQNSKSYSNYSFKS